ncbi:hypothetical protein CBM2599_A140047 [Cupriavidus taiwanensis]|nr:hypothetical protein CBM2600_A120736 [Cupriavidus taiwanensis]SOY82479.1 hypothetical protein CBM2599_A140047 [Cupriavidus taiwanensis]
MAASRHRPRIPLVFRHLRARSARAHSPGTVPAFVPPERDTNPMLEPQTQGNTFLYWRPS